MSLALAMIAAAFAGAWIPQPQVSVDDTLLLEQVSGKRVLLRAEPADVPVEARSEGLVLDLRAGPGGTWLLPSDVAGRLVELDFEGPATVDVWLESNSGEPQQWDRFERDLDGWARLGMQLPEPPEPIDDLALELDARRSAMRAAGEVDPGLLTATAVLQLETRRTRGAADHHTSIKKAVDLDAGESHVVEVRGPAVVDLATRALILDEDFVIYDFDLQMDGRPVGRRERSAGPNPETPGLAWVRRTELLVPPGTHRFELTVGQAPLQVEPVVHQLRPSWRTVRALDAVKKGTRWGAGTVSAMERAHVLGLPEVTEHAEALLGGPADELARARLIEHGADPERALVLFGGGGQTPLLTLALARRYVHRQDIDGAILHDVPNTLVRAPELCARVAELSADALMRPRADAIRRAGRVSPLGWPGTRWSALLPIAGEPQTIYVPLEAPGVARIEVTAGDALEVDLPVTDPGTWPVLRPFADAPTRYTIDGASRRGMGRLDEAHEPGVHRVAVQEGRLILRQEALIEAYPARVVYERQAAISPSTWAVPEPGAPVRVLVSVYDGPGDLSIHADTGESWMLRVPEPDPSAPGQAVAFAELSLPAHGVELRLEGDPLLAAVAWRRTTDESPPEWPPVEGEPVDALVDASVALIELTRRDAPIDEIAEQRMRRASALAALGYHGSARQEALLVSELPGISARRRAQALTANPYLERFDRLGAVTVEAAAARSGIVLPAQEEWTARGLESVAGELEGDNAAVVWMAASRLHLEAGDPVSAWLAGDRAGPLGERTRKRAEWAGTWRSIRHVDQNAGVVYQVLEREPLDPEEAGPRAIARERLLGAPWPMPEYTVTRKGRQDRITFEGSGDLLLQLICQDERARLSDEPCVIGLRVDGERREVEVFEAELKALSVPVGPGEHEVIVEPPEEEHRALVVRASLNGTLLPPRLRVGAHRVGADGVEVVIAGPALLRIKVHAGGPVRLSAGDSESRIEDDAVIPVTRSGPVRVRITGPSESLVTLARLTPAEPEGIDPTQLLTIEDARTKVRPSPTGPMDSATRSWLYANVVAPPPLYRPPEAWGTSSVSGSVGNDPRVGEDAAQDYVFAQVMGIYRQRAGLRPIWFQGRAVSRVSPSGRPSLGAQLRWSWLPEPVPFVFSARGEAYGSGSVGHASLTGQLRYRVELGPSVRFQPWVGAQIAGWTAPPSVRADPIAWNHYGYDHPASLRGGAFLDVRPLRDGRLRLAVDARTNTDSTLDRWDADARWDMVLTDRAYVHAETGVGRRYADANRDATYWQPWFQVGGIYNLWRDDERRWMVDGYARWYPAQAGALDTVLQLTWETSPRRGVRDYSPLDRAFLAAQDVPLEMR